MTSIINSNTSVENRSSEEETICHRGLTIATLPNDIFLHTFRVIGNTFDYITHLGERFNFENLHNLSHEDYRIIRSLAENRKLVAKSLISLMSVNKLLLKIATSDPKVSQLIEYCKNCFVVRARPGDIQIAKKKHHPQCCVVQ